MIHSIRGEASLWPALLLLLAGVLVPTGCVLWLLNAAVSNERLAVREKLMRAYAVHLNDADVLANDFFEGIAAQAAAGLDGDSPSERFAAIVARGGCDSAIILNGDATVYPDSDTGGAPHTPGSPEWKQAEHLEFSQNSPAAAAVLYRALADDAALSPGDRVLAVQAGARCLEKSGDTAEAVALLERLVEDPALASARDAEGRFVALGGVLRCLEIAERESAPFAKARARLAERLADYAPPAMPASQRRFLLRRFLAISPDAELDRSLRAEEMAARIAVSHPRFPEVSGVFAAGDGAWAWRVPGAVLLFAPGTLETALERLVAGKFEGLDAQARILPPGAPQRVSDFIVRDDAGSHLPGWRWVLRFEGENPFDSAAERQVLVYWWTALLVILAAAAMVIIAGQRLARHLRLARMKNELIAVVSHELKTPLASMRALVDTILEGRCPGPEQQTEYLRLIARENARLTHLIDNFLTFSRMERNKNVFSFGPVDVNALVAECAEAVRDRLAAAGFVLEIHCDPGVPPAWADADALATVVLNLLDNAMKYSEDRRAITLTTSSRDGAILIAVADQGIGMSKREMRRAFDRFYQADRHLHRRAGGCGLGLSIVKFIVDAHGGGVRVESTPGRGSTFTLALRAYGGAGGPEVHGR